MLQDREALQSFIADSLAARPDAPADAAEINKTAGSTVEATANAAADAGVDAVFE